MNFTADRLLILGMFCLLAAVELWCMNDHPRENRRMRRLFKREARNWLIAGMLIWLIL